MWFAGGQPKTTSVFFFSSRRRHTRSVSAFLLNRSSDLSLTADSEVDLVHQQTQNQRYGSSHIGATAKDRSEERRVGKECRIRGSPYHRKKNRRWLARNANAQTEHTV